LPDFVEPMKAKLVGSMPVGAWIYEIKFDGYRALALRGGGETRILSRNERDLGSKFPAVRDSIAALDVRDAIAAYAATGVMPYADLRRTEHGVPPDEAFSDAA
jgi:ATP-dependent DNA ligase